MLVKKVFLVIFYAHKNVITPKAQQNDARGEE